MTMPRAHRAEPTTSAGRRALVGLLVMVLATLGWGVVTLATAPPAGAASAAWPTSWETYTLASGNPVKDNTGDVNPATSDLTSGTCSGGGGGGCQGALPTVYYAGDASNAFFRFRMADDNNDSTKGGYFGSAFLVQMYDASNTLKAIVGVDGKQSDFDYVYVVDTAGNLVATPYSSKVYSYPWTGSSQGTRWIPDGSGQYYLDIQVPVSAIQNVWPQYTSGTPVKLYYGTSAAANLAVINKDFMIPGDTAVTTATLNSMATVKVKDPVVTFDSQGGSSVSSQSLTGSTTTATQPSNPTRVGHAFKGWFTAATGGTQWNFSTPITADTTLYAQWTQQRTVTFDSQGGTSVSTQTVGDGGTATPPTTPTRTGYSLEGWWTTPSAGGGQWDFSADTVTADITLYARWTAQSHAVEFNTQGVGTAPDDQTVPHDGLVTAPPAPIRTGYTFNGWWTTPTVGGDQWAFDSDTISGDTVLYARWTVNSYTVTFDSQGGSAVSSQIVDHGQSARAPAAPTRTGYVFDGWWTTASTGGSRWTFGTDTIADATVLYARWTTSYEVSFNTHGGTSVADQIVNDGSTATRPTSPTRTGYTFSGWYTAVTGGSVYDFATAITAATTIHAQWTVNHYPVTFDTDGGSAVSSQNVAYNTTATLPSGPARTGHTFAGWFTAPTGGSAWDFSTDVITTSTTIYARWTANSYTISFDTNSGSADPSSQSVGFGQKATEPPAPSRTGYTFDGWFTAATGGATWDFDADVVTEAVTLYAQWTGETYTVSFDTNGGSGTIADQSVEYGDTADAPTDPAHPGYAFAGWFTSPTGGTAWAFDTDEVTGPTTLFAQWTSVTPRTCVLTFDSAGGSAVASQSVTCGQAAVQPAAPTRGGYTFEGWYTAAAGDTAWNFTLQTITAATTVYARWTPVTPAPTTQAITFVPPATLEVGASTPVTPFASSGLPVTVASSTPDICVVNDGTVTTLAPGTCVLVATQSGNSTYTAAAPVTVSFMVDPLPPQAQSVVFAPPIVLLSGAGPVPLTATATSGLPVTLKLVSGACSLDGQTLTAPIDTACTVIASQEGARAWLPADNVIAQIQFVSPKNDFASMPSPITGPASMDIAVLANDPEGLRLEGVGHPARGAVVAQVDSVTYRPVEKLHGVDEFSYQVSDALGRTAHAMVRVDVANAAPRVTSHKIRQIAGTTESVNVEASDPNDDTITLSSKADKHVDVKITGREILVSPDDTASGWVTVKVSADDGFGGTGTGLIRSLVRPHPVERAVRELQDDGTMVSWTKAATDQARYRVLVDGKVVCTTTRTECLVGKVLGPDFTVKVQVLGLHGTVSTKKVAVARGHEQVLLRTVYFEPGIATLGAGQMRKLATVSELIRRLGFHDAHVSGYTDSDGGAAYNLALSRDRTKMVARYLHDAKRIRSDQAWFGYNDPVASNDSAVGKSLNRRVEILVSY